MGNTGVRTLISHHKRRTLVTLKILFFVQQENAWDFHCADCGVRAWDSSKMRESHARCVRLGRSDTLTSKVTCEKSILHANSAVARYDTLHISTESLLLFSGEVGIQVKYTGRCRPNCRRALAWGHCVWSIRLLREEHLRLHGDTEPPGALPQLPSFAA